MSLWTGARSRRRISRAALYAVVIGIAVPMLLPFYYMVITSFKTIDAVSAVPISLGLREPTLHAYRLLLEAMPYGRFVWNSLIVGIERECDLVPKRISGRQRWSDCVYILVSY